VKRQNELRHVNGVAIGKKAVDWALTGTELSGDYLMITPLAGDLVGWRFINWTHPAPFHDSEKKK
jgi:hypothetical protein